MLPKASCKARVGITGRDEALVLRGGLWAVRDFLGFQSRTKTRPSDFKLFTINGDETRQLTVTAEEYPILLSLPIYAGPKLLALPDCDQRPMQPWHKFLRLDAEHLLRKYGIEEYAPSSMNAHAFARVLFKVTHGLAVANFGINGFQPFLPDYILAKTTNFL